jgi:hypothetical protein
VFRCVIEATGDSVDEESVVPSDYVINMCDWAARLLAEWCYACARGANTEKRRNSAWVETHMEL